MWRARTGASPGRKRRGFTLLEVLVAMTIAGMALGALLAVIGGNKRLSWRSEDALVRSIQIRSRINAAQLNDGMGLVPPAGPGTTLTLYDGLTLPEPRRKTMASIDVLRGFEIRDADDSLVASGNYWLQLPVPE